MNNVKHSATGVARAAGTNQDVVAVLGCGVDVSVDGVGVGVDRSNSVGGGVPVGPGVAPVVFSVVGWAVGLSEVVFAPGVVVPDVDDVDGDVMVAVRVGVDAAPELVVGVAAGRRVVFSFDAVNGRYVLVVTSIRNLGGGVVAVGRVPISLVVGLPRVGVTPVGNDVPGRGSAVSGVSPAPVTG